MRVTRREAICVLGAGLGNVLGAQRRPLPRATIIRTILDDVDPNTLTGMTLVHEHLGNGRAQAGALPPRPGGDPEWMVEELKAVRAHGVSCVVATATSIPGPDMAEYLKMLSQRSGLHIVATGALYAKSSYPPDIATKSEEQIADDLVRAAEAGRFGAFGELAVTGGATEIPVEEKKVFRAFGRAHRRTGLPILTHNNYATGPHIPMDMALRQLDVLESVGVHPRSVALGHVCCLADATAAVPKQLAKRGAFVAFDRLTRQQQWVTDEQRVKTILAVLDAGYADHLLFSSDYSGFINTGLGEKEFRSGPLLAREGGPGWGRSIVWFHPMLRNAGVKDDMLHRITVNNPRRFLAFVPKHG